MASSRVLAPPVPARAFHLPLSPADDHSAAARSASSARVSATANPNRAAKRQQAHATAAAAAAHRQQQQPHPPPPAGARRRARSPQTLRLGGDGADVVGAATAVAAASVFAGATSSNSISGGGLGGAGSSGAVSGVVAGGGGLVQRTHSDAVVGLTPCASPSANAAPTPVSALLLVAASPFPSRPLGMINPQAPAQQAMQGQGSFLGESATASPTSPMLEDETAIMAALSSALHADAEHDRAMLAAQRSQALAQRQQVITQALTQVPPAQRRAPPTLPPAQLKSLVRSHVRHVGLSARLKTRTNVRDLREALAEERRSRALQAAHNIFLPADSAATASSASTARSIVRRRRALPPQSSSSLQAPPSQRSRVAARNASLSMLARLGLSDEEDAHLLPQPLVSESSSAAIGPAAASSSASAAASASAAPPLVVPWPSWMPAGLSAASLSATALSGSTDALGSARAAGESKEQQQQEESGSAAVWHDQFGSVIGVESSLSASASAASAAAAAPSTSTRFPAIPALPLHRASSPSLSLALSPRMPPIAAGGGTSAREKEKQRSSRLLKGSFAPTAC